MGAQRRTTTPSTEGDPSGVAVAVPDRSPWSTSEPDDLTMWHDWLIDAVDHAVGTASTTLTDSTEELELDDALVSVRRRPDVVSVRLSTGVPDDFDHLALLVGPPSPSLARAYAAGDRLVAAIDVRTDASTRDPYVRLATAQLLERSVHMAERAGIAVAGSIEAARRLVDSTIAGIGELGRKLGPEVERIRELADAFPAPPAAVSELGDRATAESQPLDDGQARSHGCSWIRLVEHDGLVHLRIYATIADSDGTFQDDMMQELADVCDGTRSVVIGLAPLELGHRLVAMSDCPLALVDEEVLAEMVWAVDTLAAWWAGDLAGTAMWEAANSRRPFPVVDVRPEDSDDLRIENDAVFAPPFHGNFDSDDDDDDDDDDDAPTSAFDRALAELRARDSGTRRETHRSRSAARAHPRPEPVAPDDPITTIDADDLPRFEGVARHHPGWRAIATRLLQYLHPQSAGSVHGVVEGQLTVGARSLEALSLLTTGPNDPSIISLIEHWEEGLGVVVPAVDRLVRERADRRAQRMRDDSVAVADWFGQLSADEVESLATGLRRALRAVGRAPADLDAVATAVAALGAPPLRRKRGAAQLCESLGRLDPFAAGTASALLALTADALGSGFCVARVRATRRDAALETRSDAECGAALVEAAIGVWAVKFAADERMALGVCASGLRSRDLLRFRTGDRIGPLAQRGAEPVTADPRGGATAMFGPPGSGKTSILNLLSASHSGPIVATTSKVGDWTDSFVEVRGREGTVYVFDPGFALTTLPAGAVRVRWDLVEMCSTLPRARRQAKVLADHTSFNDVTSGSFWGSLASVYLAALLVAAHFGRLRIGDVVKWVEGNDLAPARRLVSGRCQATAASLARLESMDPRTRDSVISTITEIMSAFSTGNAERLATSGVRFDPEDEEFLNRGTLLLCLDPLSTVALQPLVAMFLSEVIQARRSLADRGWTGPPMLIAGDEIGTIAPLRQIPQLLSEGPGRGIQMMVCLQDMSQMRAKFGQEADLVLTATGHRLFLPGCTSRELGDWVESLMDPTASAAPMGFGARGSTPDLVPVRSRSEMIRPGEGYATMVTPGTVVERVRQARAQDDPLYRWATIEARSISIAARALDDRRPFVDLRDRDEGERRGVRRGLAD